MKILRVLGILDIIGQVVCELPVFQKVYQQFIFITRTTGTTSWTDDRQQAEVYGPRLPYNVQ